MDYKLFDFFNSLKDPRRGQGQRHKFTDILTIIIMAILSGHQGLKGFAESNASELMSVLNLQKHGVPCYSTFRDLLCGLESQLFAEKFTAWVKSYHPEIVDEYIALDGKTVASTVSGSNTSTQNFISIVNAFGHQSELVYGMKSFESGKKGEVVALRELVEQLGLVDKVFTMDALHTKKKHLT
jgi:hypothetical protein